MRLSHQPEALAMNVDALVEQLLTEDFDSSLADFLGALRLSFASAGRNVSLDTDSGSKYVRVFTITYGQRSAYCFVDKPTGHVWKPASWKAPTLNFPRASIYDPSTWDAVKVRPWGL